MYGHSTLYKVFIIQVFYNLLKSSTATPRRLDTTHSDSFGSFPISPGLSRSFQTKAEVAESSQYSGVATVRREGTKNSSDEQAQSWHQSGIVETVITPYHTISHTYMQKKLGNLLKFRPRRSATDRCWIYLHSWPGTRSSWWQDVVRRRKSKTQQTCLFVIVHCIALVSTSLVYV